MKLGRAACGSWAVGWWQRKMYLYLNAFWLVAVNCKLCIWSVQNLSGDAQWRTQKIVMGEKQIVLAYCSVAIGNPEWHVRKASHRGSKQQ